MNELLLTDEELAFLRTNGIKVNYYVICHRKLWLYSKGLRPEATSERVLLGKILHERAYPELPRHEISIDNLIKIDIVLSDSVVLEIKYSSKMAEAARLQLAYYLLYLRSLGAGDLKGELCFPRERRREEVYLTPQLEDRIKEILVKIQEIETMPTAPVAEFTGICKQCSYAELCWG